MTGKHRIKVLNPVRDLTGPHFRLDHIGDGAGVYDISQGLLRHVHAEGGVYVPLEIVTLEPKLSFQIPVSRVPLKQLG